MTKTWDKLVIDRTSETQDVIEVIRRILETKPVDVLVNNHLAGYAVASIELFESLLKASS